MKRTVVIRNDTDRQRLIHWIEKFQLVKPLQFTIEHYKKRRSVSQNSYYWGVVLRTISEETGMDADDLHVFFRTKFLGYEDREMFGESQRVPCSTSKLRTMEFSDYLERVIAFATGELGLMIPEAA